MIHNQYAALCKLLFQLSSLIYAYNNIWHIYEVDCFKHYVFEIPNGYASISNVKYVS